MKKVKFWASNGYYPDREEIVEYDDDVTDEEIDNDYESWYGNVIESGWHFVEDEE